MAALHKGFPQTELVIPGVARKVCIAGQIGGVRLDHDFCFYPRLVAVVLGVQPVVDENKFTVRFRLISQAVFRIRTGSLKSDLPTTLAVETMA